MRGGSKGRIPTQGGMLALCGGRENGNQVHDVAESRAGAA